jgi:hydroxymethylpyrimidine/phosphomethylpyrimidine kinase
VLILFLKLSMAYLKQVLTIATSDSGGGAGIQGDIKAMQANGVFGLSVLVALTAQNTRTVSAVFSLPIDFIEAQLEAVFNDFDLGAVKTGMLFSSEIVEAVSKKLLDRRVRNLVVDPVMISKSGCELLQPAAVEKMKGVLFPLARLVTPNIHEAQRLTGQEIKTLEDAKQAAKTIQGYGSEAVLIKGGHLLSEPATDLLFDGKQFKIFRGEFFETPNTHGTGCTYASAIAAHLALGTDLSEAVENAKGYLTEAIRNSLSIGGGHGPTHHFYFISGPPIGKKKEVKTLSRSPLSFQGLKHLALWVMDMTRSRAFYEGLLGLKVVWEPDSDNVYLSSGEDNLALHSISPKDLDRFQQGVGQFLDHFGFIVESPQQVEIIAKKMEEAGAPILNPVRFHRDGSCSFYMADPDGNRIQILFEPTISQK